MNQSQAAQESLMASGILPSVLTDETMKDLTDWLSTYGISMSQE